MKTSPAFVVSMLILATAPLSPKKRIFDPLGMTLTHVHDDHEMVVKGRAYSYSAAEGGGYKNAVLSYANAGATSLFTTAEDLAHWLDNFGHARVGGPEVVQAMQQRFVLNGGDTIAYAQGVSIGEYRGAKTVSHSGGDAGFRSYVVWFPESKTGVVVLSNLGSFNPTGKAFEVADVVLEDEFPEPVKAAVARERVTLDEATLDRFEGRFLLSFGSVMSVEREGRLLLGRMPLAGSVELVPVSDTEFRIEEFGMLMRFHLMENPAGDSISMHTPNGEEIGNGHRIEQYEVTTDQLAEYEGVYYSPELGTLYKFEEVEGSLVAQHRRHGSIAVTPMSHDEFTGDRFFFGKVKFTRGATGHVNGFRVTGGRVRNLRFEKLDWKSW